MFNRQNSCLNNIRLLLEEKEYLRDNKSHLIKQYRFYFPSDKSSEETIGRNWRLIQQHVPELRGEKWLDRQNNAAKERTKFRNLGQIEDLSHIFGPIDFEWTNIRTENKVAERKKEAQKENWFTRLFNF